MSSIFEYYLTRTLRDHSRLVNGRVLDLGCGGKPYEALLGASSKEWFGVDYPHSLHGRASRADVFADGLRLPFARDAFDTVVCTEVLEHVPDPRALLSGVARVLRPGGYLLLSCPQQGTGLHEDPFDFYRYTSYGLRELCQSSGLTVVKLVPLGFALALVGELVLRHTGPLKGLLNSVVSAPLVAWLDSAVGERREDFRRSTIGWVLVAQR